MKLQSYTATGKIGKDRQLLADDANVVSGALLIEHGVATKFRISAVLSDGANRVHVTRDEYEKLKAWFEGSQT